MTQILFTADPHLGSPWATEHRGFTSVQSHDEFVMLELYKAVARDRDTTLYILGDVAQTADDLWQLSNLNCRKVCIMGNHDNHHEIIDVEDDRQQVWREHPMLAENPNTNGRAFDSTHGMLEYKGTVLTHCPIHPMEMYRYTLNIHGHIHGHRPQLELPYFNVNWDIWSRPVSLQEVRAVL